MEQTVIKRKVLRSGIVVTLVRNDFKNASSNYSVNTFLKSNEMELSNTVIDTLRQAEKQYNRETL